MEALAIQHEQMEYDPTERIEDPEDILTLCRSFVTYENGVLSLAHHSVKEYLTSERRLSTPQSSYYLSDQSANFRIAQTCLTYLQHFDYMQQQRGLDRAGLPLFDYPLLDYCLQFWHSHYIFLGRPAKLNALALEVLGKPDSIFSKMAWQTSNSFLPMFDNVTGTTVAILSGELSTDTVSDYSLTVDLPAMHEA